VTVITVFLIKFGINLVKPVAASERQLIVVGVLRAEIAEEQGRKEGQGGSAASMWSQREHCV